MFEKKRGKRFLASVMALVMLLSLAPVGALATEDGGQPAENQPVAQSADETNPKPVVMDEGNTANTNEESTPPPSNKDATWLPTNNNNAPMVVEGESPVKESMITHSSSSNGTAMYDYNSGTVNLRVGENRHCTVYYVENDSADLTEFTSDVYHNYRSPYGIVFFVKPDDGYALTNIKADNTQSEFYSIVDNTNIEETEFYTKNSSTGERIPSVEKLIQGGFTQSNIDSLVQKAKEAGCVAGFIFTRDTNTRGNISSALSFYAEKLATLKKEVASVKRNNVPIDLATTKVREGDVIEYSFTVTYYQGTDSITYENIRVTDSRVTDPQTMEFQGPSSGNTTETKTATYTVTEQDIINAAQNEDKLTNTATLTYTYQAPYNNGAYTVSDTATANVTTVGTVSYKYTGTVPNGVATLPATASHEKNEQVRVADRPDPDNITGYTFKGWTAPADVTVNSDGYFAMPDKSITFTGEWIANKHSVTYKDGDTCLDNLSEKVAYGTDVTVKSYSKDGDTLTGWVDQDGNTYNVNATFTMPDKDVTLTAVWEENKTPVTPTEPTKVVDAKYFVLLPGRGTPASGKDQGTSYYLPNENNNGGITGLTYLTGYTGGGLTAAGQVAADGSYTNIDSTNGVFKRTGIDASYLVVPTNLGYFTVGNWTAEGVYSPTSTSKAALSNVLGENFNTKNISIIWYSLKKQFRDSRVVYHVDGYVKDIPVTLTYHDNFTGSNDSYKQTGLKSGDEITIAPNSKVNNKTTFSHDGYVFAGWYDNAAGSGTNYAGQTHTMMDNLNLYAKWKKEDSPKQSYTLTVNYIYENGNEAQRPHVEQVEEGKTYTVTSPLIVGYTSDQTVVNGTMPNHDVNVNVRYKANEYTVTYYVDGQLWNADTQKYTVGQSVNVRPDFPKEGYQFSGWSSTDVEIENRAFTMPAKNVIINGSYTKVLNPDPLTYTINQHFMGGNGKEISNLYVEGQPQTEAKGTPLSNLIGDKANTQTNDGKKYVYVPSETKVNKTSSLEETSTLTKDTTIDLYYYLDNWKDTDEASKDSETGDDGIPDCYQVLVKYQSGDTTRGSVGPLTMEVLTIKNKENVSVGEGQVTATGSTATATGNRCYFVNWTKKQEGTTDVSTVVSTAKLTAQTFNAKGGDVYTFTANFDRSSGGSGGGSRPTVTIPDDVPTGLNGTDHYAYIIGYGNNDVRPQNNITRAEVATIFFRLLTDETRTANMTKSNSYNDVKNGDWFCCAVSTLSKMGIIKGYEDGSFKPNDPISRAEFAAIAARFDPDGDKTPATFADVTSHWAKDEISIAANHGWIKGYEDGSFKPDQKITRAETMTLVNRVLNRLPEAKDDLHKDMKTWVDNMDETAWYYLAVQEATNSHYFKNKTSTKFEQWTDLRDTRDWSELEK